MVNVYIIILLLIIFLVILLNITSFITCYKTFKIKKKVKFANPIIKSIHYY